MSARADSPNGMSHTERLMSRGSQCPHILLDQMFNEACNAIEDADQTWHMITHRLPGIVNGELPNGRSMGLSFGNNLTLEIHEPFTLHQRAYCGMVALNGPRSSKTLIYSPGQVYAFVQNALPASGTTHARRRRPRRECTVPLAFQAQRYLPAERHLRTGLWVRPKDGPPTPPTRRPPPATAT